MTQHRDWKPVRTCRLCRGAQNLLAIDVGKLSFYVCPHIEVICCRSREKYMHIRTPGDILIDDWTKYRQTWLAAGGRWITHTSAQESIDQLLEMGIGL